MRQSRAKCIFKICQACDVLLQDSEFVEQHKGLLASSSVKVCTAKDFSVQSPAALSDLLQAQQFWMALALHGLMRLFDQLIDPACALHHPSIGSVLFQYRCTACTLLCRRTPGDPAVSADAVLGKRDQILHIKPRGSLLPLWLWLTCMNLTWSYSCSVWRNWS